MGPFSKVTLLGITRDRVNADYKGFLPKSREKEQAKIRTQRQKSLPEFGGLQADSFGAEVAQVLNPIRVTLEHDSARATSRVAFGRLLTPRLPLCGWRRVMSPMLVREGRKETWGEG